MTSTERLRALLDERGIKWWYGIGKKSTVFDGEYGVRYEVDGTLGLLFIRSVLNVTPEQAIAATVGNSTDLSKRLREVHGLHAFAELFGFSWTDGSDWVWHDVACAMADAIDATVGVGTCHIETTESWLPAERYHRCKNCGAFFAVLDASHDIPPRACPNCGRRIIEEVTE